MKKLLKNSRQMRKKVENRMERVKMLRMMMTTLKKDQSWKHKRAQLLEMFKLNSSSTNIRSNNNKMTAPNINSN